jgi:hypothetical protein
VVLLVTFRELRWYRQNGITSYVVPADAFCDYLPARCGGTSNGDTARVLTVLQQGLQSAEHAEFVARLNLKSSQLPSANRH